MKKFAVLILVTFLSVSAGLAQSEIELTATVNETTISIDGYLKLKFTLKNARKRIEVPDMDYFQIVQGPQVGENTVIRNNQMLREFSQTYLVKPLKVGTHKIPPAKVEINGKLYTSNPITIKVVKGDASAQPENNSDFFVAATPNKRKAYKGEPIVVAVKLYTRFRSVQVTGFEYPELEGFWSEELFPENNNWERENLNGRQYLVLPLKRYILFPQKTGELTFGGVDVSAIISTSFFGSGERYSVRSKPITFEVLPLPDPPANAQMLGTFSQLNISSEISRTTAAANQSIELRVDFIGSGNLNLLSQPEIKFPDSFELFDPTTRENINVGNTGVTGQKSFTFVMIPRQKGKFTIPEQKLTFFDTQDKSYKRYSVGPYEIDVTEATGKNAGGQTYNSQTDLNVINQNIRGIKTETNIKSGSGQFFGSIAFYGLVSFPIVLLIILFLWSKKLKTDDRDVKGTRMRKAGKVALGKLTKVEKQRDSAEDKVFYSSLSDVVYQYLSVKFGIELASLNKLRIAQAMEEKHSKVTIEKTIQLLEACEMAQYAPGSGADKKKLVKESRELIKTIEESAQ
jgi:hypothetical protein